MKESQAASIAHLGDRAADTKEDLDERLEWESRLEESIASESEPLNPRLLMNRRLRRRCFPWSLSSHDLRADIVTRLLGGEDTDAIPFIDRLVEIAEMENGEHQMLVDPVDRSIALVFELFQSEPLDPWDVDLTMFIDLFGERIETAENIDLSCGRLIRMAWNILHAQTFSLIERHENWEDEIDDDDWMSDIGWEADFDDDEYGFSVNVLTGRAKEALPGLFQGRIRRTTESRPVTLSEMLFSLKAAHDQAEDRRLREAARFAIRQTSKRPWLMYHQGCT